MDRLTRKNKYEGETLYGSPIGIKCDDFDQLQNVYNKLGILEDFEDKLGCPLEVVFKALKEGIYIKDLPKGYEKRKVTLNYLIKGKMFYFIPSAPYCYKLFLKDYKKTWWLVSDKENE